jgi:hypothetical protein
LNSCKKIETVSGFLTLEALWQTIIQGLVTLTPEKRFIRYGQYSQSAKTKNDKNTTG